MLPHCRSHPNEYETIFTTIRPRPMLGPATLLILMALVCAIHVSTVHALPSSEPLRSSDQPTTIVAAATQFYCTDDQLHRLITEALVRNPQLRETEARWKASIEKIPQVKALPDPMMTITQFIESVETRVGPQHNILMLSQQFPWFGTLSLKGKIALQEALAQAEHYSAQQREIIRRIKNAYYDLYFTHMAVAITRDEIELLKHFETTAATRYATGRGIQQNVIKVQTEITKVQDRLLLLEKQRDTLSAMLNTLIDQAPEAESYKPADFSIPLPTLDLNQLYTRAHENRPELQATRYGIEKSELGVQLARKNFWPNFTLGFAFVNIGEREDLPGRTMPPPDNGQDAYSVSLGMNIPIWRSKLHAALSEAEHLRTAAQAQYDRLENETDFDIRDQYLRLLTTRDQLELYSTVLIPQAEQSLNSSEAAYTTGKLGFLDLLDSERTLLNVRMAFYRLKADYMKALSDLERTLGVPFPSSSGT
jgi:cobalt-zinc-cadmium efflux system outer membrane protein